MVLQIIIVTDVGGNSEAVEDGINGLVVSPKSSRKLAKAILTLLDDKELAKTMGIKSKVIAENKFSAEQMVKATEYEYMKLFKAIRVKESNKFTKRFF